MDDRELLEQDLFDEREQERNDLRKQIATLRRELEQAREEAKRENELADRWIEKFAAMSSREAALREALKSIAGIGLTEACLGFEDGLRTAQKRARAALAPPAAESREGA